MTLDAPTEPSVPMLEPTAAECERLKFLLADFNAIKAEIARRSALQPLVFVGCGGDLVHSPSIPTLPNRRGHSDSSGDTFTMTRAQGAKSDLYQISGCVSHVSPNR